MAEKKTSNKLQSSRFIEAAKQIGADETGKKFERAFKKVVKAERPGRRKKIAGLRD